MARDHDEGRGQAAVGHRDAGEGGGGHGGRDAGDDLERDAGRGQGQGLLAAAAEDERIAALEAHHALAAARGADHQRVDRLLVHRRPAARLPTEKRCACGASASASGATSAS